MYSEIEFLPDLLGQLARSNGFARGHLLLNKLEHCDGFVALPVPAWTKPGIGGLALGLLRLALCVDRAGHASWALGRRSPLPRSWS